MTDLSGTANYANYQAAIATYEADPTHDNGDDIARQQCICLVEAGVDPGIPLKMFDYVGNKQ